MANHTQITQEIEKLNEKWNAPRARDGLYGNTLKSLEIKEIRGISAVIHFTWPVMAIAGTNGSGKTTILQLCSAAYKKNSTSEQSKKSGSARAYKIGDWIRSALRKETPAFNERSSINFSFWNDQAPVLIPYQKERTRWGYPRRNNPERNVSFIGITTFAPRIERKDRLHVFKSQIEIKSSADFSSELLSSISTILDIPYPHGTMHTVGTESGAWSDALPQVTRGSYVYSEPHMGAGEQKVIGLVRALEDLPKRSLILLEEPEITLHPDAQRGLAWYLMSLSRRKGHQIILTTHSSELFEALPPEGRTLIVRKASGIEIIANPPHMTAARELSSAAKSNKDLILVEDMVGKSFIEDILQRLDKKILNSSCVIPVGNTDDVRNLVQSFRNEGIRAIGVRDPDIGDNKADHIFSLPGDQAPETLLLEEENIREAEQFLSGVGECYEKSKVAGFNKTGSTRSKAMFIALANELSIDQEKLRDRLTMAWFTKNLEQAKALVAQIKEALA